MAKTSDISSLREVQLVESRPSWEDNEASPKLAEVTTSRSLAFHLHTMYLFLCSDFKIIVVPQTVVGCSQALASSIVFASSPSTIYDVLCRIPLLASWLALTTITFNVANQRLPASILEDPINKPWRPMPSGRLSPDGARCLLLALVPISVGFGSILG